MRIYWCDLLLVIRKGMAVQHKIALLPIGLRELRPLHENSTLDQPGFQPHGGHGAIARRRVLGEHAFLLLPLSGSRNWGGQMVGNGESSIDVTQRSLSLEVNLNLDAAGITYLAALQKLFNRRRQRRL